MANNNRFREALTFPMPLSTTSATSHLSDQQRKRVLTSVFRDQRKCFNCGAFKQTSTNNNKPLAKFKSRSHFSNARKREIGKISRHEKQECWVRIFFYSLRVFRSAFCGIKHHGCRTNTSDYHGVIGTSISI